MTARRRRRIRGTNFSRFLDNLAGWEWWHGQESSGTTIVNSDPTLNGVYSGVELAQPAQGILGLGVRYDGSTSFGNIYTARLNAFFNRDAGGVAIFGRMKNAGVWIDGNARRLVYMNSEVGTANRIILQKGVNNGELTVHYIAGGTNSNVVIPITMTESTLDYFFLVLAWHVSLDRIRGFFNGVQSGADVNGLGTFVNDLLSTESNIGANDTTPTLVANGDICHVGLSNIEPSPSEIDKIWRRSRL